MKNAKNLFNLEKDIVYLNCAAYSPLLNTVISKGKAGLELKSNPQNIVPEFDFFDHSDQIRTSLNILLNGFDPQDFAIIPAVSYGMAVVAKNVFRIPNIKSKKEILIVGEEFPNNILTFEKAALEHNLALINLECDIFLEDWNQKLLANISELTALVVVPNVHWIYGYKFDLESISIKCKACGALLIIDGTQSIGALPFDIQKIKPDALISAGYKWLMGPHSLGIAYFGEFFHEGEPIEETWFNRENSHIFSDLLKYERKYKPRAQRFNMGEYSHFIQTPMLVAGLQQIIDWTPEFIQTYTKTISAESIKKLLDLGCKILPENQRASHLFAVLLPDFVDLDGLFELLKEQKIYISRRGKYLRVSPHVYNLESDLIKLTNTIIDFCKL
jgi:selenocysteine lyase/cysteine desulfurase